MAVLVALAVAASLYFFLPRAVGVQSTLRQLRAGDLSWLAVGVVLEAFSLLGQSVFLRGVFSKPEHPLSLGTSAEIALAGAAASKLVAAAGAGGIALWVWALEARGLASTEIATGMVCYEVISYAIYMLALVIAGFGLWFGLFSGHAPIGVTLLPAIFALAAIVIVLLTLVLPDSFERSLRRRAERAHGRAKRFWGIVAAIPKSLRAGLLAAIAMLRRRDPAVLGAVANWAFDLGALWASLHAFGHSPPGAVLVMAYFLGLLGNILPLPGGIGGVEGGMIGALLAFGVDSHTAVLGVLGYRTISYWLPTVPGAIAYWHLRRVAHERQERITRTADRGAAAPGL